MKTENEGKNNCLGKIIFAPLEKAYVCLRSEGDSRIIIYLCYGRVSYDIENYLLENGNERNLKKKGQFVPPSI